MSRVWCYDLGLPQLSEILFVNLVDGRVLDLLTRDELKRHLKITTKVHQVFKERGVDGWERRGEEEGEGREGRGGEGRGGGESTPTHCIQYDRVVCLCVCFMCFLAVILHEQ